MGVEPVWNFSTKDFLSLVGVEPSKYKYSILASSRTCLIKARWEVNWLKTNARWLLAINSFTSSRKTGHRLNRVDFTGSKVLESIVSEVFVECSFFLRHWNFDGNFRLLRQLLQHFRFGSSQQERRNHFLEQTLLIFILIFFNRKNEAFTKIR